MPNKFITVDGIYCAGYGWVAKNWEQTCSTYEKAFAKIRECHPGTFNVCLHSAYEPPDEQAYRGVSNRNYLSPRARVVQMNGKIVEAWILRGALSNNVLELVSSCRLADYLSVSHGAAITVTLLEFTGDGEEGMPSPPPR